MKFVSTIMTGVSGAVGNMVGLMTRGGMAVRNRVVPANPQSPGQQGIRGALRTEAGYWSGTLNEAARSAWAMYGKLITKYDVLGVKHTLTGFQAFIRNNVIRTYLSATHEPVAPAAPGLPPVTTPTAVIAHSGTQKIALTINPADAWAGNASGHLFMFVGPATSQGVERYFGPYLYGDQVDGNATPPGANQSLDPPASVTITTGKKYGVRFVCSDAAGRKSEPMDFFVLAVT